MATARMAGTAPPPDCRRTSNTLAPIVYFRNRPWRGSDACEPVVQRSEGSGACHSSRGFFRIWEQKRVLKTIPSTGGSFLFWCCEGEGSPAKRATRLGIASDQATFKFVADSLPLFRSGVEENALIREPLHLTQRNESQKRLNMR